MDGISLIEPISLEESIQKAKQAKAEFGHSLTNCYFPRQALAAYADDGRLFFHRSQDALLFLGDEGKYYQVFYFLRAGSTLPTPAHDKALVVNELDADGKQLLNLRQAEQALILARFRLESRNLCLWINLRENETRLREALAENETRLARKGFRFAPAETEEQREQVRKLWSGHLKPTDIPLSHYDFDNSGRVLCIVDEAGMVCCVIWWDESKRTSEWRHIVTHPAFLHQGLAFALLCKWAVCALDAGCSDGYSWCEEHNRASFSLQEKLGSRYSGKQSLQYVLP